MKAVAYILTRKLEADAAYLNDQGVHITIETDLDGKPFLALREPRGHLRYLHSGDALVWNPDLKPISTAVVSEPLVSAIKRYLSSSKKPRPSKKPRQ